MATPKPRADAPAPAPADATPETAAPAPADPTSAPDPLAGLTFVAAGWVDLGNGRHALGLTPVRTPA